MTIETFEDHEKSGEWLKSQTTWASARFYETHAGRKQILRCNKVPVRAKQCAASAYLLYNADSFQVMLFEASEEHDHDEILQGVNVKGLTSATKEAICSLLLLNITVPKAIMDQLAIQANTNPDIKMPKERQLYNYLYNKESKYIYGYFYCLTLYLTILC